MSTCTKIWTEQKVRYIIANLDRKTGLNGASLPITMTTTGTALGTYSPGRKTFAFDRQFFENPSTKESEVIDTIRHEYAHYYDDVASICTYCPPAQGHAHHGADWKWACRMVGATPLRYHDKEMFADKDWDVAETLAAYAADDVKELHILSFMQRWNQLPVDDRIEQRTVEALKKTPDLYYKIGDRVVHQTRGYGVVEDAIVSDEKHQKLFVRFADKSTGVFYGEEFRKW